MKKSIFIVLLFMPLLLQSCQKEQDEYDYVTWIDHEVIVCGVEDPVNNLPWISSDVLSVPMPFSGLLHLYEDTVMHEDIVVCDWRDWIAVYTCSGQLIADGVYTSLNVPDVVYEGIPFDEYERSERTSHCVPPKLCFECDSLFQNYRYVQTFYKKYRVKK